MANGIAVTPERLREISAQMNIGAAEVEAILTRVAGDVAPVRSEWVGAAQTQFNALWDQLQRDANGLQSVLTGIAKLTQGAAAAYEAAEESIAKSFNEFRLEPVAATPSPSPVPPAAPAAPVTAPAPAPAAVAETVAETVEIDVVAEAEEALNEEDAKTTDTSKEGTKPPWDRFMTSNARRK